MLASRGRASLPLSRRGGLLQCRALLTLAIESSCDDSAVAILESEEIHGLQTSQKASVHFQERIPARSQQFRGVHPIVALESHQENLANLVNKAVNHLPGWTGSSLHAQKAIQASSTLVRKPDFVSVTRGPGMRSNLSVGLELAKGLAVAWQVPLVAVHHMQAHALTPRLVSACRPQVHGGLEPEFPFLSLLVSGGHSMLLHSKSLTNHSILTNTADVALGRMLDKIARAVLPPEDLASSATTMFGPLLEKFAFPNGERDFSSVELYPERRGRRVQTTQWGWSLGVPLATAPLEVRSKTYSFGGIGSHALRLAEAGDRLSLEERVDIARESMRVAFEHLASRVLMALDRLQEKAPTPVTGRVDTVVASGGVAANMFLRYVLRRFLDANGYSHVRILYPPLELCTDNALMIAWAGLEMFRAGWSSTLSCRPIREWSLDPLADDGGILGPEGWTRNARRDDGTACITETSGPEDKTTTNVDDNNIRHGQTLRRFDQLGAVAT